MREPCMWTGERKPPSMSLLDAWPLAIDVTPALPCAIPPYRCTCTLGANCPPCEEQERLDEAQQREATAQHEAEAAVRRHATYARRNARLRAGTPEATRKHGHGDRPRPGQGWFPTPDDIAAYHAGMSLYALQRRTGKSRPTVRHGLKRAGAWEVRPGKNLPERERRTA